MDSVTLSPSENEPRANPKTRLRLRDYFLLPLISLITVIVMIGSAEAVSRVVQPDYSLDPCSLLGGHHNANCSSKQKTIEGPDYLEAYNECGYWTSGAVWGQDSLEYRRAPLISSEMNSYLLPEHIR
jgi:hypothetical protein